MSSGRKNPAQENSAGSHSRSEPAFLAVGKLRHAHGVHGEMLMEVYTDFPERFQPGIVLYLGQEDLQLCLVKSRPHREGLLVTFEGYTTPEEVGKFRNQVVYVHTDDRPPLPEGEYYHYQLIGLRVTTRQGEVIGTVAEILETGASDVLVVRPLTGSDVLIPVVDEFVLGVDLSAGDITVHLIPGMRAEEG
jgi:16S rRNA processing protein RimM